jgi:ubiquinone/menaquinone biosynthesis C-methylase UbiE
MKNPTVFDKYPHEYDLLTNAIQREKNHALEVKAMIDRFEPQRVLDAGCATGLTTTLFARRGVEAVGLDHSRAMLKVARKKFAGSDLPMKFVRGSFENLAANLNNRFDLVACLANAIVGVRTKTNLGKALRGFKRVLGPGGNLVLQLLNYAAIKEGEVMPIRVTENNGLYYMRYSVREGRSLVMNVIRLDTSTNPPDFEPFYTRFENFEPEMVVGALKRAGFLRIRQFGDLKFSSRFRKSSRDLVLVAQRP